MTTGDANMALLVSAWAKVCVGEEIVDVRDGGPKGLDAICAERRATTNEIEGNPWYSGDVVSRSVSEWLD